jgi:hypothetical protein
MAKQWVMTPARKAYYSSKRKRSTSLAAQSKRVDRALNKQLTRAKKKGSAKPKHSKEFSYSFKRQYKMQMDNQRSLYKAKGMKWDASAARRGAAKWALMGVNPRSAEAAAKYKKVYKHMFKKK